MKLVLIGVFSLMLSGCFVGVETRSGWHMISLPPSTGKNLAKTCGKGSTFKMPFGKKEVFK